MSVCLSPHPLPAPYSTFIWLDGREWTCVSSVLSWLPLPGPCCPCWSEEYGRVCPLLLQPSVAWQCCSEQSGHVCLLCPGSHYQVLAVHAGVKSMDVSVLSCFNPPWPGSAAVSRVDMCVFYFVLAPTTRSLLSMLE